MTKAARGLCLATATVLVVHQIDAGYREEWLMLDLPGGNTLNLLLNLPIIAWLLQASGAAQAGARGARRQALAIAGLGLLTATIHGGFLAAGDLRFAEPVSLLLIGAALLLSILLLRRLSLSRSR